MSDIIFDHAFSGADIAHRCDVCGRRAGDHQDSVRCDSGVTLPTDGTLKDEHWSYHVAPCGYVTRYAHDRWGTYGRQQYARHMQQAHPQRWAQIEKIRRMSED